MTRKKSGNIEISNPYRPYGLKSWEGFYHEDIIKQIKDTFYTEDGKKLIAIQGTPSSGKTSTLKQIGKNPSLLGKNYVTIYLDSRKYINYPDMDDLLFFIYKGIVEKMNSAGHQVPQPELIGKKNQSEHHPLETYLLSLEMIFIKDIILVLIFDEFDVLLEKVNSKTLTAIIDKLKNIEINWSHYGIILSSNKKLRDLNPSVEFKNFLKDARHIKVEEVLEEASIKKQIIEPVKKNRIKYDEEAIKEIIRLSGKNLYFQQLICHYMFELSQEDTFSLKLVEQAVGSILTDERPEFDFAWENILTLENRLLASALADESVSEKSGDFYFLKENAILDSILEGRIHEEMAKMEEFGYINKVDKRRFKGWPFKIPLYGEWIRIKHPFVKTVIEHIDDLSNRIDLDRLVKEIEAARPDKLSPFDKDEILEIAPKWCALKETIVKKQKSAPTNQVEDFFKSLARRLKTGKKEKFPGHEYLVLDIKAMGIGILDEAYCFIQDRYVLTQDDILHIENTALSVAQDTQTKLILFFHFQESPLLENLVKRTYLNLVAINENDMKKILLSERPWEIFRKILLSRLSLQRISFYKTAAPARATFYGRAGIINKITRLTGTSYAIVGSRRIGKTSLLLKITDNPPPNTIYFFMNLDLEFRKVKDYKPFLRSFHDKIESEFKMKSELRHFVLGSSLARLPVAIEQLHRSQEGKKIVFIFDEIDGLIEFDKQNGYKLMSIFRTLSQTQYCQFIFSGFRELYHRRRDIDSPAYNFYEEIRLTPLEKQAALDLITKPMASIGIRYENDSLHDLILGYTACHPNLLQFFCQHLVEKVEVHEKVEERRTIFRKDIEELFNAEYENFIMEDVYMFNSDLGPLDKLILSLLARDKKRSKMEFPSSEIGLKLGLFGKTISDNEVHQVLQNLVMRFILLDQGQDKYRFALLFFPDILNNWIDDAKMNKLIQEVKQR